MASRVISGKQLCGSAGDWKVFTGCAASAMDAKNFVRTRPTQQIDVDGESCAHIFAGGDICSVDRFPGGERLAGVACRHMMCIAENIERMSGVSAGPLRGVVTDGSTLEFVEVSLGKEVGMLHGNVPALADFFPTKDEIEKERGPIGPDNPWMEVGPAALALKFGFSNYMEAALRRGEDGWLAMFMAPYLFDMPPAE